MAIQEPLQESLNNVSTSPTNSKKNEPKAFYLFGTRIPVPSQDSLDITTKKTSKIELIGKPTMRFYEDSMTLSSASPVKTDKNSKTHCSSETLSEELSLACKATSTTPFTDVSMSPKKKKKNEPKSVYLFGTRIDQESPQDSYSLASTATLKRSRTMSNAKDENPKENLQEDARKIKKMRTLSIRAEVELDDDLMNIPQRMITKTLTTSDVNRLSRLLIETSPAESYILRYMPEDEQRRIQEGKGVKVKAYDHDTGTEHDLVFKRWVKTSRSYLFNGGWSKEFVGRRDLKVGDKIGLVWDDFHSRLHFCVLSRGVTANQENPN